MRIGALAGSVAQIYSKLPLFWSDGPIKVLGVLFFPDVRDTINKNFELKYCKMENIVKTWQSRSLSIIGKVTVVNKLVIPQLLYTMQCLPCLTKEQIVECNNLMRKFIWSNKKPKIALQRLQARTDRGGLNLTYIGHKDVSIKFANMYKLILSNTGSELLQKIVETVTSITVYELNKANLEPKDITNMFGARYKILKDMVKCWSEQQFIDPKSREDVLFQPIWNNSNIKIAGKICRKPATASKLFYVKELIDQHDQSMKLNMLKMKDLELKLNYLELMSIQAALPTLRKRLLRIKNPRQESLLNKIEKTPKLSKWLYRNLITNDKRHDDKFRLKWEMLLQIEILDKDWECSFQKTCKLTLSTKLRAFQYRLNNHALITNIQLNKWGIKPTSKCTFCNDYDETYIHIFIKCSKVKKLLWKPLCRWVKYFCNVDISAIDEGSIIFNLYKDSFHDLINTIILIYKHVYLCKKMSTRNIRLSKSNYVLCSIQECRICNCTQT